MALVGGVLVFGGILLAVFGVARRPRPAAAGIPEEAVVAPSFREPSTEAMNPRAVMDSFLDGMNSALGRFSFSSGLQDELARADLRIRASEFVFIQVGSALLVAMILLLRFGILGGLVGLVVGFVMPNIWIRRRQSRRQKMFASQLGDTLLLLSNALKAGYSFTQAMDTVAKGAAPPISTEFGRAVREINLGQSVEDALQNMVRRVHSDDFDLVVTAVGIHRTVGGNLAEILDTIAYTIRERVRIKGEIRTLTAQARGSGYIITALPFALSALLFFISPTYFRPLFSDVLGWVMIGMGLTSMAIGYAIIRKMVAIEV
ncbi:MAG: type II secretion system F family protein [Candidatus Dormibacteria bacterium]